MREEVTALLTRRTWPAYDRLVAETDQCYRLGFEGLGAVAFDGVGDLLRRDAGDGPHAAPGERCTASWRNI
jgi:hypothetical protein